MAQLHQVSARPVIDPGRVAPVTLYQSGVGSVAKPSGPEKVAPVELSSPVITAELLEKSVGVGQVLKIGRRSILTPSARDWLRTNRIDWSLGERVSGNGIGAAKGAARWQLIVQSVAPTVKSLSDGFKRNLDGWTMELVGQPAEAAILAIGTISKKEHDGVVILSEFAEIIACRANRNERVRAAVISDRRQLELTMTHLGVNVVCINPVGKTFVEMRNLLQDCSATKPVAPAGW